MSAKLIEKLLRFMRESEEIYIKGNGYTCLRDRKIDRKVALFIRGSREIYAKDAFMATV